MEDTDTWMTEYAYNEGMADVTAVATSAEGGVCLGKQEEGFQIGIV